MRWWSWALRVVVVAAGTVAAGVAINQILNDDRWDWWWLAIGAAVAVTAEGVNQWLAQAASNNSVRDPLGSEPRSGLEVVSAELSRSVCLKWSREEERLRLHDPFQISLRWRISHSTPMDYWANIRRTGPGPDPGSLPLEGSLGQIAEIYQRISSGRMVVLGRRGSGKSVLGIKLLLELAEIRQHSEPVPVVFNLGPWDPRETSLRSWLVKQLERDHPALSARGARDVSLAREMINESRVLPILDGFDEVAEDLRHRAMRALSSINLPLVLTSLPDEYRTAVGRVGALTAAAVIELDDLELAEVAIYLARSERPSGADHGPLIHRWRSVLDRLRDEPSNPAAQRLHQVLSTPLMVSLARTIYSDNDESSPAELLDASRFPSIQDLEQHLLGSYLPSAYESTIHAADASTAQRQHSRLALEWLGNIARQLDRLNTQDLILWRTSHSRSARVSSGIVLGGIAAMWMALAGWLAGGGPTSNDRYAFLYASVYALVFGVATGVSSALGSRQPEPSYAEIRLRRSRFFHRFIPVSLSASILGYATSDDLRISLVWGAICGLSFGSRGWFHCPTSISLISDSRLALRRDRLSALASGLAIAVAVGTGAGFIVGYSGSLPSDFTPFDAANTALAGLGLGTILGGTYFGLVGSINYGFAGACAGVLAGGPASVSGIEIGIAFGIVFGLGLGSFAALPSAWGTYTVNRIYSALLGQQPWRLLSFLDEAHHRGLLIQSGAKYRFRHAELQKYLAQHR